MTGSLTAPAARRAARVTRRGRLRIVPVLGAVLLVMLSVRVNDVWQGLVLSAGRPSAAQTAPADAGAAATEEGAPPAEGSAGEAPGEPAADGEREAVVDPFSYSEEEIGVLQSLSQRRQELDARERGIADREALLAVAEKRMDEKIAELKALQEQLTTTLAANDEVREAKLRSLVKIYESMKPKEAAAIFQQLEIETLIEVVDRMREQKAATILAQMDPAKAKEVTTELARRGALATP